jgi:hypothetical protein
MGPRLISKNLAKANEKKIHSSKRKKKERRRKGQESGRGFCSSASAFLSP